MIRLSALCALSALCVACATMHAQAPQAGGPAAEALAAYHRIAPNVIKAAEKMPAESYQFKPVADIRTYARIVNHVTEAQFHTCTALNGTTFDPKSVPADNVDKDTILSGLKASFAECEKAYTGLTPANFTETMTVGTNKRARISMAWGNISHDNEQYAELSTYLRLKGLVPPTSEK